MAVCVYVYVASNDESCLRENQSRVLVERLWNDRDVGGGGIWPGNQFGTERQVY